MRLNNRSFDEIRDIKITKNYLKHPDGSILIEMGDTIVLCTAMVEESVPFFLRGKNTGWITAEYSMIPASTIRRKTRESSRGRIEGRTQEIQRMIGRVLRSVVDLDKLGERTIWIDCEVLQADGGTRTASVSGAFVALVEAIESLYKSGKVKVNPIKHYIAAVSVGILENGPVLDMCFQEDHKAIADINIVMTEDKKLIEIQGTGEEAPFSREELNEVLELAEKGILDIVEVQKDILKDVKIKN